MRKLLLPAILIFVGFILTVPISAGETGTVTATVTPKLISVRVSPNAITYGIVELGENNVIPTPDTEIVVNNNGTVNEKLSIKGSNATATVGGTTYTWTLSDSSTSLDHFMHKFGIGAGYSTWTPLSIGYAEFVASEPAGFGECLKFRIFMPTTISGEAAEYSTTITILAQGA